MVSVSAFPICFGVGVFLDHLMRRRHSAHSSVSGFCSEETGLHIGVYLLCL